MAVESIEIVRRSQTATDAYGLPTYETTNLTVQGVLVAPTASDEPVLVGRDPVDVSYTLYFPAGTIIEEGDRFIVRGSEWVKDGAAADWGVGLVVKVRQRNG